MGPREPHDPDGRTEIIEERQAVPRRSPWRRWWVWLIILLLAVAALIGYAFWREQDDDEADRTVVPAVVGLQEAEARAELDEAELDAEVERRESSDPEGEVVDQDPEAGAQLAEGQAVRLVVSSGETETETETDTETETVVETETVEEEPEPTEMPDVVGTDFRDAADTILEAGLLATSYPVDSSEPQGVVLAQNPDAGTELPEGSVVRMNVSLGPGDRAEGDIPDVTGPEAAEALRTCHDAGYTCRLVERAAPDEESRGEIIDQRPAAGAAAPSLTQITLFLGT